MGARASVTDVDHARAPSGLRGPLRPEELPGVACAREDVPVPAGYAVFDCETTGTDPAVDEIVSLAVIRLDADGLETGRYTALVRPSRPIPAEATAVHGITDEGVAGAPAFTGIADTLLALLDGLVFVAHNARFDLAMLQQAFSRSGVEFHPAGVACTLEAFRLLEPRESSHRLSSICARRGIVLDEAHEALGDVVATAALLRAVLAAGIAPESVRLDDARYLRMRSRGDTRPASEPQVRRVFGMARSARMLRPDGSVDRDQVVALVARVTGVADVDALTREQVQDVFDELERLTDDHHRLARTA